jgi:hypothetical protein
MIGRMRAVALASVVLVIAAGCSDSSGPLSAARNLVGTWTTAFPVPVYFDNTWCSSSPTTVLSQDWDATWVITKGDNDNTVNIQMNFSTSNSQNLGGCPDTGVVPEVSPLFLTGNISGSKMTLMAGQDSAGVFDFTTDNIQGDFDYTWCELDCQREHSENRTFILGKQ